MTEKKKILIVDDEQDLLTFMAAFFSDNGFDTVTALDGVQAMEMAREEKPDLITLDMTMPKQSGVRTYRDLKEDEELKKIPVIIITAIGDGMKYFLDNRRQIPKPEGFMSKPIDKVELVKMARNLLD